MQKDEVIKLAKLARIDISEEEAEVLSHEFEAILKYVGEVKSIGPTSQEPSRDRNTFQVRNVFREDGEPHESGVYTEELLENAPSCEGDYIKVKKIL